MPSIEEADQVFDQCEALLKRYGVVIASGSRLESSFLFARHVMHVRDGTSDLGTHDDTYQWREMIGIYDLAKRLLLSERETPDKFGALTPWLGLFGSVRGQLAQTAPTAQGDQESDKIFELLAALCLLPSINSLLPDLGKGDNPDLLFLYKGQTWGIACKRLYSTKPQRFKETVAKAIAQIEASAAERGLVFVSLVNRIEHQAFYRMLPNGSYLGMPHDGMVELLDAEQDRLTGELVGLTDAELAKEFAGKKALPGIVHYVGTTYMTGSSDAPVLKTVQRAWSRGLVNELLDVFQDGLNRTSSEYGRALASQP